MLWFWDCSRTAPILHNVQLRDFWPGLSQRLANPIRYTIGDMPEDYPEPETAPEPVPTPSPAKPEIILDNLAEQLRLVLDGQRLLQHDVTVMAALVPAIANSQAAVLDELHTIREILARWPHSSVKPSATSKASRPLEIGRHRCLKPKR